MSKVVGTRVSAEILEAHGFISELPKAKEGLVVIYPQGEVVVDREELILWIMAATNQCSRDHEGFRIQIQ